MLDLNDFFPLQIGELSLSVEGRLSYLPCSPTGDSRRSQAPVDIG
jgi:hypothetical protein